MTGRQALAFVQKEGVVLESARGDVPSLAAHVAGRPIRGNWWGHARGGEIFGLTRLIRNADDVLVSRLVAGKITYVHPAALAGAGPGRRPVSSVAGREGRRASHGGRPSRDPGSALSPDGCRPRCGVRRPSSVKWTRCASWVRTLSPAAPRTAARGESPASHRDRRGARLARREEGTCREYLTDEQRRGAGGIGGRMQRRLSPRALPSRGFDTLA